MKSTARYVRILTVPRTIPPGRILVHNHVRPRGFPNVWAGLSGFRAWTDIPKPNEYRPVAFRCGWAPQVGKHYRVKFKKQK
jgi:hypothetical protein